MSIPERNRDNPGKGYSLIEMLIVTALILILATIPVALLRRSREKTHEAEALRALRMMALAYENYYALEGHRYPNFLSGGIYADDIIFVNAEEIWDHLVRQSLVPRQYSGHPHNQRDLLARGYTFSIFPADYGTLPGRGCRNSYALAMIPYEDSLASRGLAVVQGSRFFSNYPSVVPRNIGASGLDNLRIYSLAE